ncbi:MAG: hypothetical protein RMJ49_01500 [Bacteroidia bacterium]|nr:hypothetical protein [Bacteroidia bacterium]
MLSRLGLAAVVAAISVAYAQFPPRREDHFMRRKIFRIIDLREKVNFPLAWGQEEAGLRELYSTDPSTDQSPYSNREGLVAALVKGFQENKYVGYNPRNLAQEMHFSQFEAYSKKLISSSGGESAGGGADTLSGADEFQDEFGAGGMGGEDIADDFGAGTIDMAATTDTTAVIDETKGAPKYLRFYRSKIAIIEDRIFDKNRSDIYYDVQYLCLYRVDPAGKMPEEIVVCFKYKEVMDVLDDTQWRNPHNDAEDRSMREILELRRFYSTIVNVSGNESITVLDAERRRQQMIEYEHHLWTY